MPAPNAEMAEQTRDTVWWRRVAYFSLLWTLALVAAWPILASKVVAAALALSNRFGVSGGFDLLAMLNDRLVRVIDSTVTVIGSFLPSYLHPWLMTARDYPFPTILLAALVLATWQWNSRLRDRVHERARKAWDRPGRKVAHLGKPSRLLAFARILRNDDGSKALSKFVKTFVVPGLVLIVLFGATLVAAGRTYFNWYAGSGTAMCKSGGATTVSEQPASARGLFETKSMCWGSGLALEKGRKYRIWITVKEPWFDRTIMSGANGFRLYTPAHIAGLPIRRWYRADWFQPVIRIGTDGTVELPLTAVNAMPADTLPRKRVPDGTQPVRVDKTPEFADANSELRRNWKNTEKFEPINKEALPAAGDVWRRQGLADLFVAEFIAPESGELFLYVNDAIQIVPGLGALESFYNNNSGTAEVQLQRVPMPPPPGK